MLRVAIQACSCLGGDACRCVLHRQPVHVIDLVLLHHAFFFFFFHATSYQKERAIVLPVIFAQVAS